MLCPLLCLCCGLAEAPQKRAKRTVDKLGLADAPQKLTKERVCKLGLAEAPQRKVQRIEITAATLNDVKETFIREIGNPSKIDLDKNPPSGRHKEKIKNSGEVKTKVPLSENITEKTFIREIGNSSKIDLYAERCWQKKRAERRSESRKADPRERTVPCEAEMRCCPRSDHDHSNGNHNQCKSIGKERYKTQQYTKTRPLRRDGRLEVQVEVQGRERLRLILKIFAASTIGIHGQVISK